MTPVGETDKIGIILVLEHTNHALIPAAVCGNPFPDTLNYIPFTDPPSTAALSIVSGVVDIYCGYVHPLATVMNI